jgi:hypothetical protein
VLLFVGLASGAASVYVEHQIDKQNEHRATSGAISRVDAHKANNVWHLNVEFNYDIGGKSYVGRESRLLRHDFKDEREVLGHDKLVAPGALVKVHYDPKHPAQAYLQPRARGLGFFTKASVLWLGLALFWFVYDRAQTSQHRS